MAIAAQFAGGVFPVAVGLLLFIAGLSHGAGDEQGGTMQRYGVLEALAYVIVGAAVAGLFLVVPPAGLALFLILSAWHFARSDCAMGELARYAIAALATGGSALFRRDETARVFETVLGQAPVAPQMTLLALVGAGGCVLVAFALFRNQRGCGEAAIALLATAFFHPVLAVGLIFLVGHAVPIQRRQIAQYGSATVWKAVVLPTLVATAGGIALAALVWTGTLDVRIAAALAFGLATPHMLTERLER